MALLPLFITAMIGGFVAHLFSLLDRGQPFMRMTNYPIGALAATLAAWISQQVPGMHNKLLLLSIVVPTAALLLYHALRHAGVIRNRWTRASNVAGF